MKKIMLAALMIVTGSSVTSLTAMETDFKIRINNISNQVPAEVHYTRTGDTSEVVEKVLPRKSFVIEQSLGNKIRQILLKSGEGTNALVKEVKPEDIMDLSHSSGTLYVDPSGDIDYFIQLAMEQPVDYFFTGAKKKPRAGTSKLL